MKARRNCDYAESVTIDHRKNVMRDERKVHLLMEKGKDVGKSTTLTVGWSVTGKEVNPHLKRGNLGVDNFFRSYLRNYRRGTGYLRR